MTFEIVYDLRDPAAWDRAVMHASLWGRRFVDLYVLEVHHVALVFRSGGPRWELWERRRRRLIEDGKAAA
jgi:hypothetical protein